MRKQLPTLIWGPALVMLNILCTTIQSNFYPLNIHHSSKHIFSIRDENSVNSDQMASSPSDLDLQCFQKDKSGIRWIRVI